MGARESLNGNFFSACLNFPLSPLSAPGSLRVCKTSRLSGDRNWTLDSMNAKESNANILADLERYFRDPGFDRNTVLDLGKRKMSWRDTGFHHYSRSRIRQNLDAGCGIRKETLFGTQTTEVRDHAGLSCKRSVNAGSGPPSRPWSFCTYRLTITYFYCCCYTVTS